MAFTVTPTSGAVPFLYQAQFGNKSNIDGINYALSYRVNTSVGSCPPVENAGTNQAQVASDLLEFGEHTQTMGNIPAGSCRTGSLIITHVPTGDVVDIKGVFIDNV